MEKKEKKKTTAKNVLIYSVIVLFIIAVFIAFVIALNNIGLIKFDALPTNKKAELTYTETNNKQKEGIYITDVSEIVEEVMPSIVSITSKTLVSSGNYGPSFFNQEQYAEGAGSGIIISKTDDELLILTNNHVVEGAEELSIQFVNGKSVDARIKGTSARKDIAIVSVKLSSLDNDTLSNIKIATIGDSSKLKVGNGIIAIGNALGYGQSVTTGVVSALDREVTVDDISTKMIQIDAAINGGNSGGALLNSAGEVIGINSVKYSSNSSTSASIEGMGFAIPITDVKDMIEKLMNGKTDEGGGTIGIAGKIINEEQSKSLNCPTGFYITEVTQGSGADKAGLERGNIVTKIEGKEINSFSTIKSITNNKEKGDKVKLTVSYLEKNEYKEKEVEVTLS